MPNTTLQKEGEFIKETFGKYATQEIRDEILSGRVALDGELKALSVLFADLRHFTLTVAAISPKNVVDIINAADFKEWPAIKIKGKPQAPTVFSMA